MDEKLKKVFDGIRDSMTDEQIEKANECKTVDELIALAANEGVELPDEVLDMVSGGVQAGLFTGGGSGEFGPKKPEPPKPPHKTWF